MKHINFKSFFCLMLMLLISTGQVWTGERAMFLDYESDSWWMTNNDAWLYSYGSGSGDEWNKMSPVTGSIIGCVTNNTRVSLIFQRGHGNNAWWNQTDNLTYQSDKNYYKKNTKSWGTYVPAPSAFSLSAATSTDIQTGGTVTFTPSITSAYDDIKSVAYSVSPSAGTSVSGNVITFANAGTYSVTATITYNAKGFASITGTTNATNAVSVNVTAPANPTHSVSYTAEGTGWTYGGARPTTVEEEQNVSFTVTPTTGYTVDVTATGASLNKEGNTYSFTMGTSDVAITVSATETAYTVNVAAGAGGTVSPTSATAKVVTKSVEITATPSAGYNFVNWTLPAGVTAADGYTANSNPIKINATAANQTITANFAQEVCVYVLKSLASGFEVPRVTFSDHTAYEYKLWAWDSSDKKFFSDPGTFPGPSPSATLYTDANGNNWYKFVKTNTSCGDYAVILSYNNTKIFNTEDNASKVDGNNPTKFAFSGNAWIVPGTTTDANSAKGYTSNPVSAIVTYTVTISNGDHGTVAPNGDQVVGSAGLDLAVTPESGYIFDGWNTTGGASMDGNHLTATADGTVTATYREAGSTKIYFYNDKDWATVKVHKYNGSLPNTRWPGVDADLETLTHDGHKVYSVTITEGEYANVIFNNNNLGKQTSGIEVSAYTDAKPATRYLGPDQQWEWIALPSQNYKIVYGSKLSVTNSYASGSYVDEGADLTFTASVPDAGYTFAGFFSDGGKTQEITGAGVDIENRTYTVTLNSNIEVHAKYTENLYTVNVSAGEHGSVSPSGEQQVGAGGMAITATPDAHYYHSGWNTTGGASVADNRLTATADGTVSANFLPSWSVRGNYNGSWETANYIENFDGNTGYVDIELAVGTFEFKIFHHDGSIYGNNGTMTRDGQSVQTGGWTMYTDQGNCHITTDKAGIYRFSFSTDTKKLSVMYPAPDPSLSIEKTAGAEYIGQKIVITPTTNQFGELTVCYNFDSKPAGSEVTFTQEGKNVYFIPDVAGQYTISATLYRGDCGGETIVAASPIDINIAANTYRIYVGYNGVSQGRFEYDNGYSIDLEAGKEYEVKVIDATNPGSLVWYGNKGTMTATNCTGWTFSSSVSENAGLATTIAGTYNFHFDIATKKLSVTYPEIAGGKEMYSKAVKEANTDVMIQAFYWAHEGNTSTDYEPFGSVKWADLDGQELGENFDLVWLAPSTVTADYTGYLPMNYSIQGTIADGDNGRTWLDTYHAPWGSEAELKALIANIHTAGGKAIADIVINHSNSDGGDWCTWNEMKFGNSTNHTLYGSYTPDGTWITYNDEMYVSKTNNQYGQQEQAGDCGILPDGLYPDDWKATYGSTPNGKTWDYTEYNCTYSRDWAHQKREVREMSRAYLLWLKNEIGYDGWRYDFAKGFHGKYINDYNHASGAYFSVAEVFDGDYKVEEGVLADAGNNTYMFDFPGKYNLMNNAIRNGWYQGLQGTAERTLLYGHKKHAVTFVDNHDTFREGYNLSGVANTITNAGNQVLQANAYILSLPGVPCVFYPYWHEYKNEIKAMIRARKLAGIHSESRVIFDEATAHKYVAHIEGTHGSIWLKLGPDAGVNVCPDGFKPAYVGENVGVYYETDILYQYTFTTSEDKTYYSNEFSTDDEPVSMYLQTSGTLQMKRYDGSNWVNFGEPASIPSAVTKNGVYVAYADIENHSLREVTAYTGNYYIRTDKVGWSDYKNTDHLFSYTDMNSEYNYYFCVWIGEVQDGHYNSNTSVEYTVANEYNNNISNHYQADDFTTGDGHLKGEDHGANVRFTWNSQTAAMSRAYIAGSSSTGFVTVEGSNIYTDNTLSTPITSPQNLNDLQNWVYQYTLTAKSGATLTIKAVYDDQTQIFVNNKQIFKSGNDDDYCVMNVLYDFKTNHIISAWTPNGEIDSELAINTDILLMREGQGDPTQMTFGNSGSITGDDKTIYGAIHFSKTELQKCKNAQEERSRYMGSLYWISFPFDVNLSDVVGLGAYGKYWLIRYYDGAERAAKGWFKETSTFWKNVSVSERNNFVLRANEGYMLALDLEAVINDLFAHGTDDQFLYFPSASKVTEAINSSIQLTPITYPALTCTITRDDRNIKDSNWRCIGVPSYANPGEIVAAEGLKYFYAWNATNNTLGVEKQGANRGTFKSMHAYMVQFAGTIDWSTRTITPAQAAMRAPQNEESHTLKLVLLQSEKKVDQTYIELMDNTTRAFDESIDLVKMMNSTSNLYTYTIGDNVEVAANSLPLENVTIPLGITAAQDAEYCISLPDGCEGISVTLIDNETGIHTNLALYDYTVSLAKGTYNERFSIQVHANKVMTDMSSIEDRENGIRKLLIDGELFIVKDGQMYDAQGRKY